MKYSRVILTGVLALGLAASTTAATGASGEPVPEAGASTLTVADCPSPGTVREEVKVEGGKVFHNGKEVASVTPAEKIVVAMKDGKVYVGEAAEALPVPEGAQFHTSAEGQEGTLTRAVGSFEAGTDCVTE
ncbi:hypothetical protein GCM10022226_10190 [Sphaerisporangium flaviroseum]|uniref:Uncharacterized protein n=1 Tax=Sphaerisporangium flaviroseum TaxID=509199 RepID=A0ABP7HGW4_9ACTN